MELAKLTHWLDNYLNIHAIPDFSGALNGLQLENNGGVTRVAAAVDASETTLRAAVSAGCDFLLVHHGLFWQSITPLTGVSYRKIKFAMDAGLAVYSAHLPLDLHPEVGNNPVLARMLGMPPARPFLEMKGQAIGLQADWEIPLTELVGRIEAATGSRPHLAPGGPGTTRKVALVTGGAGGDVAAAAAEGIDTFITGEGPHWSYPLAEELGVNLLYAGHYATETFGVRALADKILQTHRLPWEFLDHPTGL